MKKIPTIFERDWNGDRSLVTRTPNTACDWVFRNEGVATRKWDGTSCLVRNGALYKRYELKPGKTPPEGFEPACPVDEETGKQPGWVPVGDGQEDTYYREAVAPGSPANCGFLDGTYELIGPKVQGNPHGCVEHVLVSHGLDKVCAPVADFDLLKEYLDAENMEGIVWHHIDGRMAKLKSRDFGINWPRGGKGAVGNNDGR